MSMNTCPKCGAVTQPGDNFCLNCGARIVPQSPPVTPIPNDATIIGGGPPSSPQQWSPADANEKTIAAPNFYTGNSPAIESSATVATIEHPAYFALTLQDMSESQQHPLNKSEVTIGRAPNNDIVLAQDKDKLISRYHAIVRYENGSYLLHDNGSSNGIFVNGQLLDKTIDRPLHDGDKVVIGDYTLTFCAPQSVAEQRTIVGDIYAPTYSTLAGDNAAPIAEEDEGHTRTWAESELPAPDSAQEPIPPPPPAAASEAASINAMEPAEIGTGDGRNEPAVEQPRAATAEGQADATPVHSGISVQRFTNLAQPLPDISALIDAATALNGQISALQQQLDAAHQATRGHESEIATAAHELRNEMQQLAG
ncbi:MAG: FHA domain-containing protein, partial [Ktedonobacteraceae bacterium]